MTGPYVTTQRTRRTGRAERWGYIIHIAGEVPYVSAYRWGSQKAALEAGEKDLSATLVELLRREFDAPEA